MNLNHSPKFLCHKNEDILQPINTQFSGIFNKALFTQENVNLLNNRNSNKNVYCPQSESSNSTVETIDYEFLTPHTKTKRRHLITSSPNKELNLSEYFGKFMEKPKLLQSLDSKQIEVLRKVSNNVPAEGNITFKTNTNNDLTNVIYYNPSQSKLINHNIISPSSLGLLQNISAPGPSKTVPSTIPTKVHGKRKVGRPRNDSKKPLGKELDPFEDDEMISHRTKSGRIVKLNVDIAKIFKIEQQTSEPIHVEPLLQKAVFDQHPVLEVAPQQAEPKLLPGLQEPPKKPRKISSEFRCTTCKKIYLGKNKMNHHFKLFPDHRPKACEGESVLFSYLMSMVGKKKKNKDMADVFFKEISNFVQKCEKLTPKLITNKDNHPNTLHHSIDKNAASLLRINPGNYRLNMNVFDKNFKLENPIEPIMHEEQESEAIHDNNEHHDDNNELEPEVIGNEVIKVLDDVPSLDGNEVNLLIRQTNGNELTNLTNISDIVGETDKIEQHIVDGDNALLGFLN